MPDADLPATRANESAQHPALSSLLQMIRARTPARLLVGRSGPAYRTATQLELRQDHAVALDAVHAEVDLIRDFGGEFVNRWELFEIQTQARDKLEYLMRPDLGRRLNASARETLVRRCSPERDLQVIIGDGLSAAAVVAQVPALLPALGAEAERRSWHLGQTFLIHHCRVGVLNEIGEILRPKVVVLLIGERPGLATAESLSAYMAFRPRSGDTDADRNLISNIHARGVSPADAARRIAALAEKMREVEKSGVGVKESLGSGGQAMDTLPDPKCTEADS